MSCTIRASASRAVNAIAALMPARSRSKITSTLGRLAVAVVLAAGLAVVAPSTAQAAPSGCSAGGGFTYSTAYCSGGTGSYQAYATCKQTFWPYYSAFVQSGWVRARSGQTAWAWCPFGYNVMSRGVGIRN